MRISDWSSDVCSSDLLDQGFFQFVERVLVQSALGEQRADRAAKLAGRTRQPGFQSAEPAAFLFAACLFAACLAHPASSQSLQSRAAAQRAAMMAHFSLEVGTHTVAQATYIARSSY